jgi:predicted GIY-YIG superfamily endonuclease
MTLTCYLIQNNEKTRTYVGATNNFDRRIRQHNQIIKGGAKATKGYQWSALIHVLGFITRTELLQFEWIWKHYKHVDSKGLYRRIDILEKLLEMEKWKHLFVKAEEETAAYISIKNEIVEL